MILVADSGSSKTDWRLINGQEIKQFESKGLNPDFNSAEDVNLAVAETFAQIELSDVTALHFYGSGCSSPGRNEIVASGIRSLMDQATINIYHDLLGAARATSGYERGIIGILGTGSNCCLYDGKVISHENRSGGYILGDEGGGVDLGKRLIKAFIEDYLPIDLRESFIKRYDLDVDSILHKLYKETYPNRFLASFSQFVFHHREHAFISMLIQNSFNSYFERQVMRYHQIDPVPLHIVGSIAYYYREYLEKTAQQYGVQLGRTIEKPIAGLSEYHLN